MRHLMQRSQLAKITVGTRLATQTRIGLIAYEATIQRSTGLPGCRMGFLGGDGSWERGSFYFDAVYMPNTPLDQPHVLSTSDLTDLMPVRLLPRRPDGSLPALVSSSVDRVKQQADDFLRRLYHEGIQFPKPP